MQEAYNTAATNFAERVNDISTEAQHVRPVQARPNRKQRRDMMRRIGMFKPKYKKMMQESMAAQMQKTVEEGMAAKEAELNTERQVTMVEVPVAEQDMPQYMEEVKERFQHEGKLATA